MNEGISPKGLRDEWSLLLHSFLDDRADEMALVGQLKTSEMSLEQIRVVRKELSSKRKKMNQSIERIKIKIDQVNSVIENLELVGSDATGLLKEIDFLSHEGQKISEQITELDYKIKRLHDLQDMISP